MPARILLLLVLLLTGCAGSRWAKDDPDYAAKYPRHTDDVGRTIKQAFDARHLAQKGGAYGGLSARDEPFAMGGEAGLFRHPNPYLEGRVGLAGLIYEDDTPVSGGVLAAARLQTPTRLAPFVGIGAYAGMSPEAWLTDDDIDNDFDGYTDESDEADNDFVFALVPEAGCHFWLTPGWRLTGSASYHMTDAGRDSDFPMIGISLACLTDLGIATNPKTLSKQARDRGWQIGDGHTPQHVAPTAYEAPSEPLARAPKHLSEETVERLPGDIDDRPTAYDGLPTPSATP
jgi:hypothetical protein